MTSGKIIRTVMLLIFMVTCESLFAGGGWPQKKGKGYFKLSQYVLRSDQYFNPEGDPITVSPGISVYNTTLYGEYGLTD